MVNSPVSNIQTAFSHLACSDPANTAQKDSPYYEVIQPVPLYERTHSVLKKHHNKIDKEGNH